MPCNYGNSSKSSSTATKVAILSEEYQKWGSPTVQHQPRRVARNHSWTSEPVPVLPPTHSLSVVSPWPQPLVSCRSTVPVWTNPLPVPQMQSMSWSHFDEGDSLTILGQVPVSQPMSYTNMQAQHILHQPPYAGRQGMQPDTDDTDHREPPISFIGNIVRQYDPALCMPLQILHIKPHFSRAFEMPSQLQMSTALLTAETSHLTTVPTASCTGQADTLRPQSLCENVGMPERCFQFMMLILVFIHIGVFSIVLQCYGPVKAIRTLCAPRGCLVRIHLSLLCDDASQKARGRASYSPASIRKTST